MQKVVIENKDFEKLIRQYDRPVSFFYADPPYYSTESYYANVGFTADDHIRLCNAITGIQGKFLVSYNDCEEIRDIYSGKNLHFYSYERINNIKQRYDKGSMYKELLIANYDLDERNKLLPEQLYFRNELEERIIT